MGFLGDKFEKIVVVLSTGRTGTTALAAHLDKCYPQVRALHEPAPSWRLRMASVKAVSGRLKKDELVRILTSARRDLLAKIDRPIYVESNPYLMGFLEALDEVMGPRVHVLHVVRDPRSYVRSGVNFGAFRGLKRLASNFYPYWFPKPEIVEKSPARTWGRMEAAERLAWFWATVNRELDRGAALYGERYLRVRYEDLFAKDGSGLNALTDWVGLPRSEKLATEANRENVNASKIVAMSRWEQWPAETKAMLLRHCGQMMREYGYLMEPSVARATSP